MMTLNRKNLEIIFNYIESQLEDDDGSIVTVSSDSNENSDSDEE